MWVSPSLNFSPPYALHPPPFKKGAVIIIYNNIVIVVGNQSVFYWKYDSLKILLKHTQSVENEAHILEKPDLWQFGTEKCFNFTGALTPGQRDVLRGQLPPENRMLFHFFCWWWNLERFPIFLVDTCCKYIRY